MHQWLAFPWLRYSLWLIAGILTAHVLPTAAGLTVHVWGLAALLFLLAVWALKHRAGRIQVIWGVLALVLIFFFGYHRNNEALQPASVANADATHWLIEIEQEPLLSQKNYRFKARVRPISQQTSDQAEIAKKPFMSMIYLPRMLAQGKTAPATGQTWLAIAQLRPIPSPLNPYEFDYRKYLATQGMHHQLFIKKIVEYPSEPSWYDRWRMFGYNSKRYMLAQIARFLDDNESVALVNAMVLGDRASLDRDLRQSYADAGVMHVLAVSGLHVGILFAPLFGLYRFFQRRKTSRLLWLLLVLLILWSYAWLTGLAPSALRATIMFSIIAVGSVFRRSGNIYNSIGLSAFILLAFDPQLIRQVGFQLSYLAVIGIVYLQPRIAQWYQPEAKWKKWVWSLFSVSMAAQIATFPLGLFYFHQFPTYFFVGNFLAVPLAMLIVYGTLGLMLLHWIPLINQLTGWLVDIMAQLLNTWVHITEALPYSRLVATITSWEALLIYAVLISMLLLFRSRRYSIAVLCFCMLITLAVSGILKSYQHRNQRMLTLYHIPAHSLLHLVEERKEVLMPLGKLPEKDQLMYHVQPLRIHAGLASQPIATSSSGEPFEADGRQQAEQPQDILLADTTSGGIRFLVWHGLRMAIVDGSKPFALPVNALRIDLLLLRNDPAISAARIQTAFNSKQLVLDGSNSWKYLRKLAYESKSLNLPLHVTAQAGAYHLKL